VSTRHSSVRHSVRLSVLVVGVALLAGACSSGGSKDSGTSTVTTAAAAGSDAKATFLTAANAICKSTNVKTAAVGDTLPKSPTGAEQAVALDKSADIIAAAIVQMKALDQPGGDDAQLATFYQRSAQLIALTHQLADGFRADDSTRVTAIETKANTYDDQLTKAADAYGLRACGSGSGS
jgi:hypothetical protein